MTFDVHERRYPTYAVFYRCCRHCLLDPAHGPDRNRHPAPCGGEFGFCSGGGDEWSASPRNYCEFCDQPWSECRCPMSDRLAQVKSVAHGELDRDDGDDEWCAECERHDSECTCHHDPLAAGPPPDYNGYPI